MSGTPACRLDPFYVVLVVVWGSCVSGTPACRLDPFHVVLVVVWGSCGSGSPACRLDPFYVVLVSDEPVSICISGTSSQY